MRRRLLVLMSIGGCAVMLVGAFLTMSLYVERLQGRFVKYDLGGPVMVFGCVLLLLSFILSSRDR